MRRLWLVWVLAGCAGGESGGADMFVPRGSVQDVGPDFDPPPPREDMNAPPLPVGDIGPDVIEPDDPDAALPDVDAKVADAALLPSDAAQPDGTVDPGPDAQTEPPCEDGIMRACPACAAGRQVCADGLWGVCVGAQERCNDTDDDCDGEVDEDFRGLGGQCMTGRGACAAMGSSVCNAQGDALTCDAVPGIPADESCDGIDQDCDGEIDEGADGEPLAQPCFDGALDQIDVGVCVSGMSLCEGGEFVACVGAVLPMDEGCNERDDDCDGTVDEGEFGGPIARTCYAGPDGTAGVGICREGQRLCVAGTLSDCDGQVVPAQEICDGLDNDCNGEIDDVGAGGCACEPGTQRECYTGPQGTNGVGICAGGRQACAADGLSYGPCEGEQVPDVERCDGSDEDCDGEVDEALAGAEQPCVVGAGACERQGETVCDPEAGSVVCDAFPGNPVAERCNAVDDDCDGTIDEGLGLGSVCAEGVGACRAEGATICRDDAVVCGARPGAPGEERCNAVDDDCDGDTDEGLGLGVACSVGTGACENDGEVVCTDDGGTRCDALPIPPAAEACNGLDDDCDNRVDEGNPEGGLPCETGQPGQCAEGISACRAGGVQCEPRRMPVVERCNGLDDDCDGEIDEGEGGPLTVSCYTGEPGTQGTGVCRSGRRECRNGTFTGCLAQVTPGAEICDRADNDCDGELDEVAGGCACGVGDTQPCYAGPPGTLDVGPCGAGEQSCRGDGSGFGACEGSVLPGEEVCNGVDDDCNGLVDDVDGVGDACSVGQGACQVDGQLACNDGEVSCDAVQGGEQIEVCNGEDDDCNGLVDDVAELGDACTVGVGGCARPGARFCDGNALGCDAEAGSPQAESCNGIDDDCDGRLDEGVPGVGDPCAVGIGACRSEGVRECGPEGIRCSAEAGASGVERCNGVDDDCDGVADETFPEAGACAAGLGVCRRDGQNICANGAVSCDATAGPAGDEVCGGGDEDCDGNTDEGNVCRRYATCQEAFADGARVSGVVQLQPPGAPAPVDVYCDQETDGGGWTLVGSTRGTTLNDQASPYYADLATLAPAQGNPGIWDGLRPMADRMDVRFACRPNFGAAADPLSVDLSFYDVGWYHEFTTGTDAESCFSEDQGLGEDRPPPARRDNTEPLFRPVGHQYSFEGYLEGEDRCDSSDDFTVDLDDRGMDAERDSTDWGEDDGTRKCGEPFNPNGQWFVFAREPRAETALNCPDNDFWEANNVRENATELDFVAFRATQYYRGIVCDGDSDWYQFTVVPQCVYLALATFPHADGDLDMEIFAPINFAERRYSSVSVTDDELVEVPVDHLGTAYLRVYGWQLGAGGNDYELTIVAICE